MTTSRVLAWLVGYHCLVSQFSRFLIGLLDYRSGTSAQVPNVHHPIRLSFTFYCPVPVRWTPRLDLWEIRSQQIKESCGIQPINEWVERRRREWDQHVTRMDAERLVKISRDIIGVGRSSPGCPKRRWSDLIID